MYNLVITNEQGAFTRRRYGISRERFGEHTTEGLRARFAILNLATLDQLKAMPALLAYERWHDEPARVARITRITLGSNGDVRFDFEVIEGIDPIPAAKLSELKWELDITDGEMNRTHWAIKEIDLMEVLQEVGILERPAEFGFSTGVDLERREADINPTVFAIPTTPRDSRLVAVMMPFSHEFNETYQAIKEACEAAGLHSERADTVWEEATIIQEVFNLIHRSEVTIVDLSGRNPNVMYECGIAHTLGRPVLPISRSTESLPFDLAHHRILAYLPNAEGLAHMREKLVSRLRSMTASSTLPRR